MFTVCAWPRQISFQRPYRGSEFDAVFQRRLAEADDFYARKIPQDFHERGSR